MLDLGPKPFAPQGKAGSWGFAPDCMALCWVFYVKWVSAFPSHLDVGVLSFAHVEELLS